MAARRVEGGPLSPVGAWPSAGTRWIHSEAQPHPQLFAAPFLSFDVGPYPRSVVLADFNGDGHLDACTANQVGNSVSLLLGDGAGVFRDRREFEAGQEPVSLLAADVNMDRSMDLVVSNWFSASISVLLGTGAGFFEPPVNQPAGGFPGAIASEDLNRDGIPDLMVANYSPPKVSVLLGKGNGRFELGIEVSMQDETRSLVAGELNGDGLIDLVVLESPPADEYLNLRNGRFRILLGNGDGSFRLGPSIETRPLGQHIVLEDVNLDDALDVVLSYEWELIQVWLGNGDGTVAPELKETSGAGGHVAAGDLNDDGVPDLVQPNAVYLGHGDGTFAPSSALSGCVYALEVVLGDVNSDSHLDAVIVNGWGINTLSVVFGNGDGTLGVATSVMHGFSPDRSGGATVASDLNSDGRPDLVVATGAPGEISALAGLGDGSFHHLQTLPAGGVPVSLAAGDANADGLTDIAALGHNGVTRVYFGNGDGTLRYHSEFVTDLQTPVASVLFGDLNSDGRDDAVVSPSALGTISSFLANEDGSFGPRIDFDGLPNPGLGSLTDFDRDGSLDLAVATATVNAIFVLFGKGDGRFDSAAVLEMGSDPLLDKPFAVSVGDLNGDCWPDVVATKHWSHQISVFLGGRDRTFGPRVDYPTGIGPWRLEIEDLDGDGLEDVVTTVRNSCAVSVHLGDGRGGLRSRLDYGSVPDPRYLVVGDFTGDARPDLLVSNFYPFRISLLENRGSLPLTLRVAVDIRPGTCRNALNLKARGAFLIAIPGQDGMDVGEIVAGSLRVEGIQPRDHGLDFADVSAANDTDLSGCHCQEGEPDGRIDLVAKFGIQEVAGALETPQSGEDIVLRVTGLLRNGTRFEGRDRVATIGPSAGPLEQQGESVESIAAAAPESWAELDGRGVGWGVYPNPWASGVVRFQFLVPSPGARIEVSAFDVAGRKVADLWSGWRSGGWNSVSWETQRTPGGAVPAGVYLVRVQIGSRVHRFQVARL